MSGLKDSEKQSLFSIRISGRDGEIFTVIASDDKPVRVFDGVHYVLMTEPCTYKWEYGENTVLSPKSRIVKSKLMTGIYYFYLSVNEKGLFRLLPSITSPYLIEDIFIHPGIIRSYYWNYVGFHKCVSTNPILFSL